MCTDSAPESVRQKPVGLGHIAVNYSIMGSKPICLEVQNPSLIKASELHSEDAG